MYILIKDVSAHKIPGQPWYNGAPYKFQEQEGTPTERQVKITALDIKLDVYEVYHWGQKIEVGVSVS